jgi:predicted dithiol-disulfide oxidoreductase (DUF899 family)
MTKNNSSMSADETGKTVPGAGSGIKSQIQELEENILKQKKKLADLRKKASPEAVTDYTFQAHDGSEIRLSDMFGPHHDLILVHNMGKACPYCTLWADGFTGHIWRTAQVSW